jgi:hypothetical protein
MLEKEPEKRIDSFKLKEMILEENNLIHQSEPKKNKLHFKG